MQGPGSAHWAAAGAPERGSARMGLLGRFINVVRANLNAWLNRAEDPAKLLDQALLDMDGAYRKAKEQVARAIADQKRLEKAAADQRAEMQRWEERAVHAVEQDDDDLAREALRRKQEHARLAEQFAGELESHAANVERLRAGLNDLENKLADLRRRKNLLVSRQRRVEAQQAIHQTLEGINAAGTIDTVNRMEAKIEEMGAVADARESLSREFSGDAVEQRFQALEGGGADVDAELLELKQRRQITHTEEEGR